ncbi:MAG: hypothetical protein HXX11_04670 [Desulfuromonadales bacterium]|nr:hypothetical protein [Desulfuromonadales bacterium]
MKRYLYDNQGIALVTALMMTLISMAIIMTLLYVMTASTQRSGAAKRYHSVLEAANGGAVLVVKDLMPYLMNQFQSYTSSQVINNAKTDFAGVSLETTTADCLKSKMYQNTANWPTSCNATFNPKTLPDVTMTLQATSNTPFTVYAKIVDTIVGNSDTSGSRLEDGSGAAYNSATTTPMPFPYMYRLEVQGERQRNSIEKSNISVLYAY